MRIVQAVTYVSMDGAFGGPTAVAFAQCEELASRGHRVDLFFGWDGKVDIDVEGVNLHPHRVRRIGPGFSGLYSESLSRDLREYIRGADIVHLHAGRDLFAAQVYGALRHFRSVSYVVQPHGMLVGDRRLKARVFDAFVTRRGLSRASHVLALGPNERRTIESGFGRGVKIVESANGIHAPMNLPSPARSRKVVFIARLHPRKRVLAFAHAAIGVIDAGVADVMFEVYGPDEGDLAALLDLIATRQVSDRIRYMGAVRPGQAQSILQDSLVYVLPSRGEVFPMTVLESLAVGTPVITTGDSEISELLARTGSALITDGSPRAIQDAMIKLVSSDDHWNTRSKASIAAARDHFSIDSVVDHLEVLYGAAPTSRPVNDRQGGR